MYGAVIALEVMQEIQKQKEIAGRSLLYKVKTKHFYLPLFLLNFSLN
jgi:hypothetical protein